MTFYQGLGLQPIVVANGPDGVPQYARLRTPDGEITLSLELEATPPTTSAGRRGPAIYFECEDLDERVRMLLANGHTFTTPPRTQPWLWREADLADPDGHTVRLYHAGSYRLDPPWRLPDTPGGTPRDAAGRDAATDFTAFLATHNQGYADARIPAARDEDIAAYLERLIAGGADTREAAASAFTRPYTFTLLTFAERMATRAVRDQRDRPALLGLFAIGMAWREAADVRAAVPILGVLYDAAARAGADPARIFTEAQALLPDDVAPVLRDFLTRPDLDGIAAEMGYADGSDRDGFRYRRLWGSGLVEPES